MNIGIVGSRRRTRHEDFMALYDAFDKLYKSLKIGDQIRLVSGGCPTGADSWVDGIAEDFGLFDPTVHDPKWDKYGKGAGLVRNTLIAQDSDILIAVVAHDRTGGTEDTIKKFKQFHPDGQVILV